MLQNWDSTLALWTMEIEAFVSISLSVPYKASISLMFSESISNALRDELLK